MTNARAVLCPATLRFYAGALTAAVLVALAGCAAPSSGDLAGRAQRESQRETRGSFAGVAVPPGLPPERFAPATTPDAYTPASEIASSARVEAPAPRDPNPDALRAYIAGRSALVDGDASRAVEALERAVDADPEAAAAWRDLGEARREAGDRFGSDAAHRQAITINPNERRSLVRLGLDAAARREFDRAIDLLARIDLHARPGDPAEPYLVHAALGQSLIETGRLTAGAELLAQGVDLPEHFSRPTLFPNDLSQLYRSRGDAWTAVGDARARLDEPAAALHAYERASELPSFDPVGLLARRIYALLAAGRPASAGAALIGAVASDGLTLEDQHLRLIAYLREETPPGARIGDAIERELAAAAAALTTSDRRRLDGRLALARAAALPDARAAAVLRERLASEPGDSAAISQLLARTNAGSPAALAEQVAALIDASPLNERAYTRTAVRLAGDAQSLYDALPDIPATSGGALLRARLAAALDRTDEAEETLTDVIDADPTFTPAVSALAELLLSQRRYEEASAVVERLDESAGEPALLAKAHGLAGLGRASEAVDLLRAGADAPGASANLVYELGGLLERLGDFEGAARRYTHAVALDRLMESAHAARIRLFNQGSPLADRERMFAAVRDLREAIPSARTLRWLRAQELASSGQYGAAERALRELAEEGEDPLVERALVSVWIATSSPDRAEAWLREKLVERPDDSALVSQLARAVAAQGRHGEAATLIERTLEGQPNDASLSIQLEALLRDHLGRGDEADELTLSRLASVPPSLNAGLQEAAVWLRREHYEEAAHAVTRGLSTTNAVRPDELRGALAVAQTIGARSQVDPSVRPLAIGVLDAISARNSELPEAAHRLRAILMVLDGASSEAVRAVVARAYQDLGDEANDTATAAAQAFVQQQRAADGAAFLEALVSSRPTLNEPLVTLWLSLVWQFPDPAGAERFVGFLLERGAATNTLRTTFNQPNTELSEDESAGEIAQQIAEQYARAGDPDATEAMYRVVLRFNPLHVMANNNLGYQLLVRGGDLDEAERMIQHAYEGDPNSAAVVDSLGWVRYLKGVVEDETDESGLVLREGAIGLLERAIAIGLADKDPGVFEIHLHLGDAYWRAGQQELAIEQWKAGRLAAQALAQLMGENTPEDVTAVAEQARERLDAAQHGGEPAVAPLASETAEAPSHEPGEAR